MTVSEFFQSGLYFFISILTDVYLLWYTEADIWGEKKNKTFYVLMLSLGSRVII